MSKTTTSSVIDVVPTVVAESLNAVPDMEKTELEIPVDHSRHGKISTTTSSDETVHLMPLNDNAMSRKNTIGSGSTWRSHDSNNINSNNTNNNDPHFSESTSLLSFQTAMMDSYQSTMNLQSSTTVPEEINTKSYNKNYCNRFEIQKWNRE